MKRRHFITLLGGLTVAMPVAVGAQQRDGVRRLGVLMGGPDDPLGQARATALVQGLGALNWHEGGNLRTDWRVRLERGDQALIAAISGPTPKIVIIRLRL